jgi:hypothetical protein
MDISTFIKAACLKMFPVKQLHVHQIMHGINWTLE